MNELYVFQAMQRDVSVRFFAFYYDGHNGQKPMACARLSPETLGEEWKTLKERLGIDVTIVYGKPAGIPKDITALLDEEGKFQFHGIDVLDAGDKRIVEKYLK